MFDKYEKMKSYLTLQSARCRHEQQQLLKDDRADEAVFSSVRGNIYSALSDVLDAALKLSSGSEEQLRSFFLSRSEGITEVWKMKLNRALENNNAKETRINQLKLDAANDVLTTFRDNWEGRHD